MKLDEQKIIELQFIFWFIVWDIYYKTIFKIKHLTTFF